MPVADLPADLPIRTFASRQDWADWLAAHAEDAPGVWIRFAKKASGIASVTYDEALEAALCFGWIDGQVKRFDERYFLQRFTPRRRRSVWSKRNVGIVERLSREGRMQPRGLREVECAKADGRWEAAYDGPKNAKPDPELEKALRGNKKAEAFFESLSKRNQFAILYQVQTAKRPETKRKRIDKLVAMLAEGKKLYP